MKRLFLLLLLAAQFSFATVVVNSFDGRDVVSGAYYAAVKGDDLVFITPSTTEQAFYESVGTGKSILLIQSKDYPVFAGVGGRLTDRGNTVELLTSADSMQTNLDLAQRSGASRFILVDPVYGYNTISAIAYAKQNSMYLVFVDKDNVGTVASTISGTRHEDILLYGYTDSEVKAGLQGAGLTFREINTGDKFDDNLELVKLFFAKDPSKKQVILADGASLEATIASGEDPVVLISPIIPTAVRDYIKSQVVSGQIKVAMIVDQSFSQTAYDLKTAINNEVGSKALSVFVKMGQGTDGQMKPVEFFPLPGPEVGLSIRKAEYNQDGKSLEITYENTGNALEYVQSSVRVYVDGSYIGSVGDEEPFPVERGRQLGKAYPLDIQSGQISANITSFFGSSKKSREAGIQVVMDAGRVQFTDTSSLSIPEFTHDQETDDLIVSFSNNGSAAVYFRPYAIVSRNGTKTTIKDENTYQLAESEGRMVKFPGVAKSGSSVLAGAEYGSREAFLDKTVEKEYVAQAEPEKGPDVILFALIGLAVVGVLVIVYFAYARLRK
jgi:hypothetical protein